jgi:pyruvate formate lyase activating enzyme
MPVRGAYIKTSLVDFPGRLAAVLFLPGCNFRCPYCHNADLVRRAGESVSSSDGDDSLRPIEEFYAHLDKRKSVLSGAVVSGGEPLLYPEAAEIAAEIRRRGLMLKLDTNGSFPDRIEMFGADYVALDFKTSPSVYARVAPDIPDASERFVESLRILRRLAAAGKLEFEIRITCAPGIVGSDEIDEMVSYLEPADRVYLQAFRPGGCLDPAWDSVQPYASVDMERFLALVRGRAPRARIRGA